MHFVWNRVSRPRLDLWQVTRPVNFQGFFCFHTPSWRRDTAITDMLAMGLPICMLPHLTFHGCCGARCKSSRLHRVIITHSITPSPETHTNSWPLFPLTKCKKLSSIQTILSLAWLLWPEETKLCYWWYWKLTGLRGREKPSKRSVLSSLFME